MSDVSAREPLIGQKLDHYRITNRIGSGGMGVVYLAYDEQLQREVAVKVISSGLLTDESARRRFRQEALALAKLNHPNIETAHEFGSQGTIDFLVTEYVLGTTLDERLVTGSLSPKDVARLGTQLAQGLSAAHEHGIVHRDLKPANLRLTPDGRLKILDFGLARLISKDSELETTLTLTQSGAVTGTLPYMAPEQLRGEGADERSDIWACGAVLYEMGTGQRPFPETNGPLLIEAILNHDPQPPSKINRQVSAGLENVILKALAKEPAYRYQTAQELSVDLERLTAGVTPLAKSRSGLWSPRLTASYLTVLLAIAVSGYFFSHRGKPSVSFENAPFKPRRSVAVLGFKNLAGNPDLAWLSTALSEMLTTELAEGEQLRTVPGENVARMRMSLVLPDADSYGRETLTKIRKTLGTDDVVVGSFVPVGTGQIRLDLRLQDAIEGETLFSISQKGSVDQLDEVVSKAGAVLRAKLGASGLSESQSATVRASMPSNPEAARLYAEGLSKLRIYDALAARGLLEKAMVLEPDFALTHAALASAWQGLGYDTKANEEAKKAFELSKGLSREDSLLIEARYREAMSDWDRAVENYHALFSFYPDNLNYGLQLSRALSSAGKGQDALATVESLRRFPPPQRDDPRIDLTEGTVATSLGDFQKVETSAARAAEKAQAQGSTLLVADARLGQCVAFRHLGKLTEAIGSCEAAQSIYAAASDRGGLAKVLTNLANIYYGQGDLARAKKVYEETLTIYREIGNLRGTGGALDNIANVVGDLGDPIAARKLSEESLGIYREISDYTGMGETLNNIAAEEQIAGNYGAAKKAMAGALEIWRKTGNRNGIATTTNNLADILLNEGDIAQAEGKYQEALKIFRDSGETSNSAYPIFGLGEVLSARGNLAGAKDKYEETLAISLQNSDKHQSAVALFGLGQNFLRQGELATALEKHEAALAIRKEIGEKGATAESTLALASLALEERHLLDAEKLAQTALDEFQTEKLRDDEVLARVVLAWSLLEQHKAVESRKQVGLAANLALKSHSFEVRIRFAIADAVTKSAMGDHAGAAKGLETNLEETATRGYLGYQYDVELALAMVEMESGNTTAGRARLQELEKEASAKGFYLIARKATAAANIFS
jgi:serine/threonine protein kinase/tetratricopeptide (TPR) repeat protein